MKKAVLFLSSLMVVSVLSAQSANAFCFPWCHHCKAKPAAEVKVAPVVTTPVVKVETPAVVTPAVVAPVTTQTPAKVTPVAAKKTVPAAKTAKAPVKK